MKFLIVLVALVASVAAGTLSRENIEPLSVEHVEYINSLNVSWKAGHNFKGLKLKDLKRLCGTILEDDEDESYRLTNFAELSSKLPANFDSTEQWPKCKETILHVRDQGSCGSCWAVASSSAISSRSCIASDGENKAQLSEQTLTSCCDYCYEVEGCQGGYPIQAYLYWVREGLVTGGDYGSKQGCLPYQVQPCEHHNNNTRYPPCGDIVATPKCSTTCSNKAVDFKTDKSYGKLAFRSGASVGEIQTEILKRGPVTAGFVVYDDFFLYKEGIYRPTSDAQPVGGHAVEIYGWGTAEDGTEYWKAKNSWNTDWGNAGFFNIEVRAGNIHKGFVSGIPKPKPKNDIDLDDLTMY